MKNLFATLVLGLLFTTNVFANSGKEPQKDSTTPVGNAITVKVVDGEGKMVFSKKISINEFLETQNQVEGLPQGSLFLLYEGNTAYYLVDVQN